MTKAAKRRKLYRDNVYHKHGVTQRFYRDFVVPTVKMVKGETCEICGSLKNLDVHHSSLEVIDINTLKVFCRKCHKKVHPKYDSFDYSEV